jgi:pimeloyl-ACP methyl ester carboxylesterase
MAIESSRRRVSGVELEIRSGGEGRALLFLHGGLGFLKHEALLEALAAAHRVIAPAHPGFEASEWPQEFRSVADIAYLYLDLADELKLEDATLVGTGFGGWLALEILVRSTARFARCVLVNSLGLKFGDRETRDIADLHALAKADADRVLFHDAGHAAVDTATMSDGELTAIARNREAFTFFGWKPYMHNPSLSRWLHRIDIPVLVAWGSADRFVDTDYGRKLNAAIPAARFAQIDGAGHYPAIEKPEALTTLIRDFAASKDADAAA